MPLFWLLDWDDEIHYKIFLLYTQPKRLPFNASTVPELSQPIEEYASQLDDDDPFIADEVAHIVAARWFNYQSIHRK